jgi:SAM-dependent MidA family methyltransferase
VFVGHEEGRGFFDIEGAISKPELAAYFERLGLLPGEGCFAEVNLDAPEWMARIGRLFDRVVVLTLDYGAPASDLYAPWRRDGTLLCFHKHVAGTDPYVRVGEQDMTAHVDFTSVVAAGREAGLEPLAFARQWDMLTALGIWEGLEPGEGPLALEQHAARRQAALELLDSAGLGRIRALVTAKGVAPGALLGFPGGIAELDGGAS